jgi:hypothetical protein
MTANQTRTLMVKAKALYHIADLNLTIRRGDVKVLTEAEASKSNDLWRGQNYGVLEVKWVYAGTQVAVPKVQTVVVDNRAQVAAHTQQLQPAPGPATQQDVQGLRQSLDVLRADLTAVAQQAAFFKAEMLAELAKLETRLADLTRAPKPDDKGQGPKRVKPKDATDFSKEPTDAGMD